jgi:hypothetical protein
MPRIRARIIRVGRAASLVLLLACGLMAQHAAKRHPGFGNVPLYFEENRGQTNAHARYIARSANLVGFVTQDGWALALNGHPVSMHIADANVTARLVPEHPVEGITNYYLGSRAITALPHYSSVRGNNIRPGIDVVYHGSGRALEYDLAIHPGADVNALRLRFEGSRPTLADNGDIVLKTSTGEVRQHQPRVWQEADGQRKEVTCRYRLADSGEVAFVLSNYDRSAELVVDPIISYPRTRRRRRRGCQRLRLCNGFYRFGEFPSYERNNVFGQPGRVCHQGESRRIGARLFHLHRRNLARYSSRHRHR